jgi:hypothetical protein
LIIVGSITGWVFFFHFLILSCDTQQNHRPSKD